MYLSVSPRKKKKKEKRKIPIQRLDQWGSPFNRTQNVRLILITVSPNLYRHFNNI